MWNKVCVSIPTYKRSETFLPRFIDSLFNTVQDWSKVSFQGLVNINDRESKDYLHGRFKNTGIEYCIITESLPNPSLSRYFNMLYNNKKIVRPDVVATELGDDMEFVTIGWESIILDIINSHNGIGAFYCSGDERFHDGLCVNLFVTRKMVDMCGGTFMCEWFPANGCDMVWQLAADAMGLDVYVEDVVLLHHQCSKPGVGWDDTFRRLDPMRKLAIKRKPKEAEAAMKMAIQMRRNGINREKNNIVHHIQHKRPGREVIKDGKSWTYDGSGGLIPWHR